VVPGEVEVRRVLRADGSFDPRREALLSAREAARAGPPLAGARSGRAEVVRAEGGRLDLRAEGPGLLVIAQSFDPGWAAVVEGAPAPVLRANGAQLAVPLASGPQRVALRYHPPGLRAGAGLALATALGLLLALVRERGSPRGLTVRGGA
jgi:hypothetical protein